MKFDLSRITGHRIHTKSGKPCLLSEFERVDGIKEIQLPWRLIDNSEEEVTAKIDELIFNRKRAVEDINLNEEAPNSKTDDIDYSASLRRYNVIKYIISAIGFIIIGIMVVWMLFSSKALI